MSELKYNEMIKNALEKRIAAERKRERDRKRAKRKYDEWKAMPPETRPPSYYEKHREERKAYARRYYYTHKAI